MIIGKKEKKTRAKRERPIRHQKVYSSETYLMTTVEGNGIISPTNAHFLQRYFPWAGIHMKNDSELTQTTFHKLNQKSTMG